MNCNLSIGFLFDISETTINHTVINGTSAASYQGEAAFSQVTYKVNDRLPSEHVGGLIMNKPHLKTGVNSYDLDNRQENRESLGEIIYKSAIDNFMPEDITFKPVRSTNHSSQEAVGCPYYYDWCMNTPEVVLWQFLLGTFFIAIGYPICNVMSYSLYSKILGPKPQV